MKFTLKRNRPNLSGTTDASWQFDVSILVLVFQNRTERYSHDSIHVTPPKFKINCKGLRNVSLKHIQEALLSVQDKINVESRPVDLEYYTRIIYHQSWVLSHPQVLRTRYCYPVCISQFPSLSPPLESDDWFLYLGCIILSTPQFRLLRTHPRGTSIDDVIIDRHMRSLD